MPVHHRLRFLTFPMRASRLCSLWPDMRPLRFRRAPFGRDGTFDLGGATASRIRTCCLRRFRASRPPQNSFFRGSTPHPIRSLCTLRTRRRRRLRNTRFPAAPPPYRGRSFTGRIASASPDAPELNVRIRSSRGGVWREADFFLPDARTHPGLSEWSYHLIWSWTRYRSVASDVMASAGARE